MCRTLIQCACSVPTLPPCEPQVTTDGAEVTSQEDKGEGEVISTGRTDVPAKGEESGSGADEWAMVSDDVASSNGSAPDEPIKTNTAVQEVTRRGRTGV